MAFAGDFFATGAGFFDLEGIWGSSRWIPTDTAKHVPFPRTPGARVRPIADMTRSVPIVLNLCAGRSCGQEEIHEIERVFAENGLRADIHTAHDGSEVLARTRDALRTRPEVVVAAGGDGTVSAVVSCIRGSGVGLAVLPIGTLNHFARDLGIPADMGAIAKAIAEGRRTPVDLGEVNQRPFINNASLGLYPDIVRDRTRQQRRLGRGKYWAMLWATLSVLRRSPWLRLHMEIDGQRVDCRSPFVFVGNNDYVMSGFNIGTRSSLRDGRLSIYTTQRRTRWGIARLGLRALLGRLEQARDFAMASAQTLRIDSHHHELLVAADGEVLTMRTPLEFRVLPGALDVIVPAA